MSSGGPAVARDPPERKGGRLRRHVKVRLAPLEPESLVDQAYVRLRALILSGGLSPGEQLRQQTLAGELGISRTPLREALNRLASEGLIEFRLHRSAVVAEFSQRDIEADYEARRILEPAAARLAAQRCDPKTIAALKAALEAAEDAGDDLDRQFAANRAFHRALVAGSGNPNLVRFSDELWGGRVAPYVYARQTRQTGRQRRDRREHARIVRLIAAGDGDEAAAAVDEHLGAALQSLLEG
jgi:DNA-binding GntR family transcriptional regulator